MVVRAGDRAPREVPAFYHAIKKEPLLMAVETLKEIGAVKKIVEEDLRGYRDLTDMRLDGVDRELTKIVAAIEKMGERGDRTFNEINKTIIEIMKATERLQALAKGLYISMGVVVFIIAIVEKVVW